MDGGNVLSVSHGCFVPDDYYLCNSSSVVHMTTCCTAYDACNNNIPLPPKATSTVSSSNLPGIRGTDFFKYYETHAHYSFSVYACTFPHGASGESIDKS